MKNIFLFFLCAWLISETQAQSGLQDSIARSRIKLTKNAMITLGSWALANIGSGFIIASQSSGEPRYFWLMNGYWNFINLGLAVPGYLGALRASSQTLTLTENIRSQLSIQRLYLINVGLDLVYIAGGIYLGVKGSTEKNIKSNQQLNGYGNSIVLQGAFLLLMDGVMFTLHHHNTKLMNGYLRQLEIQARPGGLGLIFKF